MSHIVDNSKHFSDEGVEKGKLMCKHCKNIESGLSVFDVIAVGNERRSFLYRTSNLCAFVLCCAKA